MNKKEEISEELVLYYRIYEAYKNSYEVLIENKDPYRHIHNEGDVVFAHDIEEPLDVEQVQLMISYWEEFEEYEKCAKLKKLEDEITRLSRRDKEQSIRHLTSS